MDAYKMFMKGLKAKFGKPEVVIVEELKNLRRHFRKAMDFLQQTPLKQDEKTQRLIHLPWFLVVGTPGCGKSTLLRKSGLEFIFTQKFPILQTTTAHCDWWLTKEGVFLDIAGKYLALAVNTEDKQNHRFHALVKLLHRYHRKRRLRGIILTLSLNELLHLGADHEHFKQLQTNLTKLTRKLSQFEQVPLQIVITQTDLLAGFNEYFADFTEANREASFGVPFPPDVNATLDTCLQHFDIRYREFLLQITHHLVNCLHNQDDASKRALLQHFPLQMEQLKLPLASLLTFLFNKTKRSLPFYISGIYFVSSLQQGQAIDCFQNLFQENFGTVAVTKPQPLVEGQTLFIQRPFINCPQLPLLKQSSWQVYPWMVKGVHYSYYFSLALLASLSLYLWLDQLQLEVTNVHEAEMSLAQYNISLQELGNTDSAPFEQVILPLNALARAQTLLNERRGWWLPLFRSENPQKINETSQRVYEHALQTLLLPQLREIVAEQLSSGQINFPSQLYATLKTYLMLGDPKRLDPNWILRWANDYWQQSNPQSPELLPQLLDHLKNALKTQQTKVGLNNQLIAQTRAKLYALPPAQLTYALLLSESNVEPGPSLSLFAQSKKPFFLAQQPEIPYFYTKKGYEDTFLQKLPIATQTALTGDWVLGRPPIVYPQQNVTLTDIKQQTRTLYLSDYAEVWQNALTKLELTKFSHLGQLIEFIAYLTSQKAPMTNLVDIVNQNTEFLANESMANHLLSARIGMYNQQFLNLVDLNHNPYQKFTSPALQVITPWQRIQNQLKELQTTLMIVTRAKNPGQAAYQISQYRMSHPNETDIFNQITVTAAQLPPPLKQWLQQLGNQSWSLLLSTTQNYVNALWLNEIQSFYASQLENRYPLSRTSTVDASVNDFTQFFAPQGIFDSFFRIYLAPFVNMETQPWSLKQRDGLALPLSQESLQQFNQIYQMQQQFFPSGAPQFMISFKLVPIAFTPEITRFNLQVDDQVWQDISEKSKELTFNWSATQPLSHIRYEVMSSTDEPVSASFNGPWALLRMIDSSSVQASPEPNSYEIVLTANNHAAKFQIITLQKNSPFAPDVPTHISLPQNLWWSAADTPVQPEVPAVAQLPQPPPQEPIA